MRGGFQRAAGDREVGTYYVMEFTSGAHELEEEYNSPDYGVLYAGARVLDARRYLDLVYGPDKTPRWYTPNPAKCVVPFELVLHASFGISGWRRRGAAASWRVFAAEAGCQAGLPCARRGRSRCRYGGAAAAGGRGLGA